VVTLSGGLPYAVEEYVRAMLETGVLRPSWGTWLVDRARLASLSLPADIARLLSERIDGLSPATRALLDAAAVLGTSFRLGEAEDRKSTRLNSSHVKISYAVFCLKKKTSLRPSFSVVLVVML